MRTLTLDLLRHGETTASGIYQGVTDVVLSERGQAQMQAALDVSSGWQNALSSPLRRCAEMTSFLSQQHDLTSETALWLQEYDFGRWDGRSQKDVYAEMPEQVERFWQDPERYPPPGGETLVQLQQRVVSGIEQLWTQAQSEHVLLLTHGGVIRACVGWCLQVPAQRWVHMRLDHACFTRLCLYEDGEGFWPEVSQLNSPGLPSVTGR